MARSTAAKDGWLAARPGQTTDCLSFQAIRKQIAPHRIVPLDSNYVALHPLVILDTIIISHRMTMVSTCSFGRLQIVLLESYRIEEGGSCLELQAIIV